MNDRLIENLEADLAVAWQDLQETQADIKRGKDVPESQRQRLKSNVKEIERKIENARENI